MKRITSLVFAFMLFGVLLYWIQPTLFHPKPKPLVIALVQLTKVDDNTVAGFKAGLEEAGYHEGEDVVYLSKGPAGMIDKLDGIIREHLTNNPDLIVVSSTPGTMAVKRLTQGKNIPVVFAPVNDPLSAGIVDDLKQPRGYITGIRLPTGDDLRLKWLVKIAPKARRIFVPYTPGDKSAATTLKNIAEVAPGLGLELLTQEMVGKEGVEAALRALPSDVDAIFLPRDSSIESHIETFVDFANRHQLVLNAPSYSQVEKGALLSYGFVHTEIGRQAARQATQIFKGANPGNLPVEMAESILSINTASAQRIGLTIPDAILHQAEKLIRE